MSVTTLRSALQRQQLSLTKPRQLVYDVLSHNEPLTMQELVAKVPAVNRSSVYRTVQLFERLGIVQRLQIGWKYKLELSNEYQEHHHHLTCLRCGATFELAEDALIEARLQLLAKAQHFIPQDHQLEVRGICAACQNPKRSGASSGSTRKPHTS